MESSSPYGKSIVRRNSVRYEVRVVDSAHKQLDKLSGDVKERVLHSLFDLEEEPRPVN